jgi:hypothetical protein
MIPIPSDAAFLTSIEAHMAICISGTVGGVGIEKETDPYYKTIKAVARCVEAYVASFYWTWGIYCGLSALTGLKLLSGIGPFNLSLIDPCRICIYLTPLFLRFLQKKVMKTDKDMYFRLESLQEKFHQAVVITNLALLAIGLVVSLLTFSPLHIALHVVLIVIQIYPSLLNPKKETTVPSIDSSSHSIEVLEESKSVN